MVRFIVLSFLLTYGLYAVDYTNMFYTSEPFNSYNEETLNEFNKKQNIQNTSSVQNESSLQNTQNDTMQSDVQEDMLALFANADTTFKASFGLVWQYGFDEFGNNIQVGLEYTLPELIEDYDGVFGEVDLSVMLSALSDSVDVSHTASYAYLAFYAGYSFEVTKEFKVKPRVGISVFAPSYNFIFAGATALEYEFDKGLKFMVDVSVMQAVFFVNAGIAYTYDSN